jgi:membrane-associated phospholipid phosphatase
MFAVIDHVGEAGGGPEAVAQSRRRWRAVCLAALAVLAVLTVVAGVQELAPGEAALRDAVLAATPDWTGAVARVVNPGGSWRVLLPAGLILLALSPEARRRWWLWMGVMPASAIVEWLLKTTLARPRPEDVSAGFPSGHAAAAAAFAVIVAWLVGRSRLRPATQAGVCALVLLAAVLVGLARIQLRAHWPSDVLGGWALGIACAAGAAWWDLADRARRVRSSEARSRPLADLGPRAARNG